MSRPDATLTWLSAWVGTSEGPHNAQPFSAMAGLPENTEWCAILQVAAAKSTAEPLPDGAASAFTPTRYSAYRRAGLLLDPTRHTPAAGDLAWMQYDSMLATRLLGIAHEIRIAGPPSNGLISTIEGNANAAASNSGGQVARLTRRLSGGKTSRIIAFARPAWDGRTPSLINLPPHLSLPGYTGLMPQVHATDAAAFTPRAHDGALTVDGRWGQSTTRALQAWLGVRVDGNLGPVTVKALQRKLNTTVGAGLRVDGDFGPATIRALQALVGTPRDGQVTRPVSLMVKALQAMLNTQAGAAVAA